MITVPSQEIAAFLGNHLDHVLQRTGTNFLSSVAADREFRAGCAIMDVLNAVESVQSSLRGLLEKSNSSSVAGGNNIDVKGAQPSKERQVLEVRVMSLYLLHCLYSYLPIHQNPFLCLFVDIYNLASQDENLKSERFVTSVILNGKGEELAPKTPSELIALAQKIESKPVNLGMLEEYLPEVPIEDQVKVGLGWDSQQQRLGDKKRVWETTGMHTITATKAGAGARNGSRHGDENDPHPVELPVLPLQQQQSNGVGHPLNGVKENGLSIMTAPVVSEKQGAEDEEEEELEEWEIEAERRFQDSDADDAPSLPSPASKKSPTKPKALPFVMAAAAAAVAAAEPVVVAKKISPMLEQATAVAAAAAVAAAGGGEPQDQVKRRRKMWPRK